MGLAVANVSFGAAASPGKMAKGRQAQGRVDPPKGAQGRE